MKKIVVITTSRADYGLLKPVINLLDDPIIICSGSHLSQEHGMTKNEIDYIDHEVEILLSSDTEKGVCSAAGLALIKFGELFDRLKPDLVLVLGDRFEILSACMAAHIHRIPIAHISGGEISGNYDNNFRNCITQLSTYHFPATEKARDNIIQMRLWDNKNIHMVGALGYDGLKERTKEPDNKFMVIVHPETLSILERGETFYTKVNDLLKDFGEYNIIAKGKIPPEVIWIMPNADNDRYKIADYISITGYTSTKTLPRNEFIKELSECKAIIGNSSSSVIEAPALGVPSILIGERQKGRELAESIIYADPTTDSIKKALTKLESKTFQDLMKTDYYMPYRGENVSQKIVEVLNGI